MVICVLPKHETRVRFSLPAVAQSRWYFYTIYMTPEEKALLLKTAETVKENNMMLRKMRRGARVRAVLHLFYWLVIIGFSFGAYYFLEPYIVQIEKIYSGLRGGIDNVRGTADALGDFGKFLQQ